MNIAAQKLTPTVTTGALPASRKIHITGEQHPDIRVPMREISLHPTSGEPPVIVYDASGPYTDPNPVIAIEAGLPRLRESWIIARGDTEVNTNAVRYLAKRGGLSIEKARTMLGYEPQIGLAEGMAITERWLREQDLV